MIIISDHKKLENYLEKNDIKNQVFHLGSLVKRSILLNEKLQIYDKPIIK